MAPGVILRTLAVVSVLWRLELQIPGKVWGCIIFTSLSPVRGRHVPSREARRVSVRWPCCALVVLLGDLWIW